MVYALVGNTNKITLCNTLIGHGTVILQQKNGSRGTWVRKFSKTLTNLESSVNVNFCQKFGRQKFGTSCKLHFQVSCNNNNNYKKRVVSSQTADCHSRLKDFESYCRLLKRTMTIWGVIQVIYFKKIGRTERT